MHPEKWERVKELFDAAEPLPAAQRQALLDRSCHGDLEIRREVERLLAINPESAMIDKAPIGNGLLQRSLSPGALQDGEILAGRFRIERWIGAGGMGEVYAAHDNKLDEVVAIKTIRTESGRDGNALARFRREISLARQVTHPSVCRVYDLFNATRANGDSIDFLTMEYINGETLAARLKRDGAMSLEGALPIIEQVASALDVAHQSRVMHRDLKCSNILLGKNLDGSLRAVVTDFGLARSISGGDTIATGSGFMAGTPAYMAPEQLEGKQITPAADIYSLGVVMYEMATRTTPHASESPLQVAARRMKEDPVPPGKLGAVHPVWEASILKCLAHEPANRFASGAEVITALRSAVPVKLPKRPIAIPKWLAIAALALPVLAATGWYINDSLPPKSVSVQAERYYRQGVDAITDGAFHKASQVLELALQSEPSFAAARCRLAEAYQELDQRDKAREELMKALDGTARARHERLLRDATMAYLVGDWNKAATALKARIERVSDTDRTTAMLDLARLYDRASKPKEAVDAYKDVLARDPSQPGARVGLARLLDGDGKRKDALALLSEAERLYLVTQNPEGLGLTLLARSFMEDNADKSIALAKRSEDLATQVGSPSLLIKAKLRQAQRLDYQGKGDEATALANTAVNLAEENGLGALAALGLIDLGMPPFSQRQYERAEAYFQRALQLAKRHGAKRTEASAKLTMGHLFFVQGDTATSSKALSLLQEASSFFANSGEKSLSLKALRYRGEALSRLGKLDEARRSFEQLLPMCDTPADQIAVKTSIAKTAYTEGKLRVATPLFLEAAQYFKTTSERQLEQTYWLFYSRSLRSSGKLSESEAVLHQLAQDKLENNVVRETLDTEFAALDFQMQRFEQSFSRTEALLEKAERNHQPAVARSYRLSLCLRYAEAGRPEKAIPSCTPLLKLYEGQPTRLSIVHQAFGIAYRLQGHPSDAINHSREAVRLAAQAKSYDDTTTALITLTQALHAAKDAEWKQARINVDRAIEEWKKAAGTEAVDGYFSLPIPRSRLTEIKNMN